MASKLFGGASLSDIARSAKERPEGPTGERGLPAVRAILPAAEMAITGRTLPALQRENIFQVDPKRVRGWKYHNRSESWYTRAQCQDLIDSIGRDEQLEPALARRVGGDPQFDYELIYGMRRRYACEVLGRKLRIRVIDADDARAAVLMHIENADRQDITPMERALSFLEQLEAKIFATQEALSEAMGLSKGQVAKMLKAAQLVRHPTIGALFRERSAVPVEQTYKLATLMERPGAKEVVLKAAQNLKKGEGEREAGSMIKALLESLDRSKKFEPVQKQYNVGAARRVIVTRNARGKVTLAFPQGLKGVQKEEVLAAVGKIVEELG